MNLFRLRLKVAYCLVDRFHKRERVGIIFENVLEIDDLVLADNAQQNFFCGITVRARAGKTRCRAVQFLNYFLFYLLRMRRYYHKLVRRFRAFEHKISD